jgi:hypothetical protein
MAWRVNTRLAEFTRYAVQSTCRQFKPEHATEIHRPRHDDPPIGLDTRKPGTRVIGFVPDKDNDAVAEFAGAREADLHQLQSMTLPLQLRANGNRAQHDRRHP